MSEKNAADVIPPGAVVAAEKEYHAIKIKDQKYILVDDTGDEVIIVNSQDIGDYNMVKGNLGKQGDQDTFSTQAIKYGSVQGGIEFKNKCGGGRVLNDYSCIVKKLLKETSNVENVNTPNIRNLIFGNNMTLRAFPLVSIAETEIILLFNENHRFMFLTSTEVIDQTIDMEKLGLTTITSTPLVNLTLQSIDSITKSAQLEIPIMHVTMQYKEYNIDKTIKIPLYILPIETGLADPLTSNKTANNMKASIGKSLAGLASKISSPKSWFSKAKEEAPPAPIDTRMGDQSVGNLEANASHSNPQAGPQKPPSKVGELFNKLSEKIKSLKPTPPTEGLPRPRQPPAGGGFGFFGKKQDPPLLPTDPIELVNYLWSKSLKTVGAVGDDYSKIRAMNQIAVQLNDLDINKITYKDQAQVQEFQDLKNEIIDYNNEMTNEFELQQQLKKMDIDDDAAYGGKSKKSTSSKTKKQKEIISNKKSFADAKVRKSRRAK